MAINRFLGYRVCVHGMFNLSSFDGKCYVGLGKSV